MTQEEKQLLLRDLCARLPYGVNVLADMDKEFEGGCIGVVVSIQPYVGKKYPELKGQFLIYQKSSLSPMLIDEVRPYLRPMSSMSSKEWVEYCDACVEDEKSWVWAGKEYKFTPVTHREEFLNSHHFDYRGLIPMGLALEAKEGMYE